MDLAPPISDKPWVTSTSPVALVYPARTQDLGSRANETRNTSSRRSSRVLGVAVGTVSCGNWCVYFEGKGIACHTCPERLGRTTPRNTLGTVDPFRLAKGLARKKEQQRREGIPILSNCPQCHKPSLFYDKIHDCYECLNIVCLHKTSEE